MNRTIEGQEGHWPYVLKRSVPAGLATLSVGVGINHYIVRNHAKVAAKNVSARTFMMLGTFLFGFMTTTEVYSLKYERRIMNRINNIDDDHVAAKTVPQLPETVTDRAVNWLNENRFKAFLTAWIASLGAAGFAVSRDKYMTTAQKVVQARMYAQGFTLLLIVGSAGLTMLEDKGGVPKTHNHTFKDDTWKTLINDESK
ncbi:hypothetical protein V1512DRAFT_266927 [Lipomyces arxii]|uniref:uncharacterized protein n=1 Tax=Lipomyces arxii TaxID=56418 RepID=UPI0034CF0936